MAGSVLVSRRNVYIMCIEYLIAPHLHKSAHLWYSMFLWNIRGHYIIDVIMLKFHVLIQVMCLVENPFLSEFLFRMAKINTTGKDSININSIINVSTNNDESYLLLAYRLSSKISELLYASKENFLLVIH